MDDDSLSWVSEIDFRPFGEPLLWLSLIECGLGLLPETITLLTNLHYLDLSYNHLDSVDELDFARMSNLTYLNVSLIYSEGIIVLIVGTAVIIVGAKLDLPAWCELARRYVAR
jgi:hypothetical protein